MASQRNIPDYPEEIMSLPMFHPDICCRQQAESYVSQHSQGDGSYIVRPNTDNDPSFVSITTMTSENTLCNVKVHLEKTTKGFQFYISDKLKFPTFNKLLSYYLEHRIICKQNIKNLRLLRPLRKINQPIRQRVSLDSIGEEHRHSTSSSSSDDAHKVTMLQFPEFPAGRGNRNKQRAMSESQLPIGQHLPASELQHRGSLNSHSHGRGISTKPQILRTTSDNRFDNLPGRPPQYINTVSNNQDPSSVMRCRPPAPLPRPEDQSGDDSFYYTIIDIKKDYFHEVYQYLKETELCECGLRLSDSELALGWTIHRSHDPATLNHIFFQQGEITTWEMPVDLASEVTRDQIKFIFYLCKEGKQPLPLCLRNRLDKEMVKRSGERKQHHL